MASLKDDFIYDEKTIDAEIEAMENDQFDLGETLCVCEGFETDEISDSCAVGWFHYECAQSSVLRSDRASLSKFCHG